MPKSEQKLPEAVLAKINEAAREWAQDYTPFEDWLEPPAYAEFGFKQGYLRAIADMKQEIKKYWSKDA